MNPYLEHFPPIAPAIREKDVEEDFSTSSIENRMTIYGMKVPEPVAVILPWYTHGIITGILDDLKQIIVPEEFKEFVQDVELENFQNGFQWERVHFEFPNGYGASVINSKYDVGQTELAVLWNSRLCYNSPITDDVIRMWDAKTVDGETLESLLGRIRNLEDEYSKRLLMRSQIAAKMLEQMTLNEVPICKEVKKLLKGENE